MPAPYATGGCARDQSTTQYCGEAVAAHARIAELEALLAIADDKMTAEAAARIDRLELALHQIAGHGNITGERARQIAAKALGVRKPD